MSIIPKWNAPEHLIPAETTPGHPQMPGITVFQRVMSEWNITEHPFPTGNEYLVGHSWIAVNITRYCRLSTA